jgi:hydroxymethylglutaryl-CoA synthase
VPGIVSWGAYLPYRRLDRSTIAAVAGSGGGKGTRTVASYDEDATTMAVEAGRLALRAAGAVDLAGLWFATTAPPYLDRTNATAIHAALRLPRTTPAYDCVGSVRSSMGALRAALGAGGTNVVAVGDLRTGLPGSAEEAASGDAGAALVLGEGDVAAEVESWSSTTEEFVDRWRTPGAATSKLWEERFGETRYLDLGIEACEAAGVTADGVDHLIVVSPHARAAATLAKKLGGANAADALAATVGNTGAAAPFVALASVLDRAEPGQRIALVVLADGADVVVLRTTDAIQQRRPARTVDASVGAGAPVGYGTYLAWRGLLPVEPPRRPEPQRPPSSAAARNVDWKFAFVGPDGRVMADAVGTIATFTIDRLAYSPSPPIVFAVVDFDGGGRAPLELTDVDAAEVAIGMRVEMTFRKLFTADGIHNYFWKARPVR